jgi:hypothetical protein
MKRDVRKNTILFSTLFMAILMCYNLFYSYNQVQTLKTNKSESEWNEIEAVLKENQEKALMQANDVKDNIVKDLNTSYGSDKATLRYDMDYLDVNSTFLKTLSDDIDGRFINVDNDNNDLFIISTWQVTTEIDLRGMIITDKSINCAGDGKPRYMSSELAKHYNYELGYDALKRIMTQNKDEIIFWEYLPSADLNHKKLSSVSLEALKEVYMKEGLNGLKTYEFLVPVYINDNTDIFGTQVINNMGSYDKDNRQMIVVQGFSIYDAVQKNHSTSLLLEDKLYDIMIIKTTLYGIFGFILTFVIMTSITKAHNLTAELEELGDDKTRRTKE